jgi:PPP family 3-phenylpropionic acid transporter
MADRKELPLALLVIASAALAQASHAEIYSFGTLHWRAIGLPASFIGLAWAAGVACECLFFVTAGRLLGGERNAASFLVLGAAGALLRWVAMSFDPPPLLLLALQSLHALTFAATYTGSVLILGRLAGPRHRARMQGWLAAASALTMAGATLAAGRLTSLYGEHAYLAMAGLAGASLVLALGVAAWRQQARHE